MISLLNKYDSSEGEQWGRYNLPRSYPLRVFKHGWLENRLWIDVSIRTSPINGSFSIAIFDCRRVNHPNLPEISGRPFKLGYCLLFLGLQDVREPKLNNDPTIHRTSPQLSGSSYLILSRRSRQRPISGYCIMTSVCCTAAEVTSGWDHWNHCKGWLIAWQLAKVRTVFFFVSQMLHVFIYIYIYLYICLHDWIIVLGVHVGILIFQHYGGSDSEWHLCQDLDDSYLLVDIHNPNMIPGDSEFQIPTKSTRKLFMILMDSRKWLQKWSETHGKRDRRVQISMEEYAGISSINGGFPTNHVWLPEGTSCDHPSAGGATSFGSQLIS